MYGDGESATVSRKREKILYLADLSRSSVKELGAEPDEEERDDLSEIKESRGTAKGKDGEPIGRLDDVGRLAEGEISVNDKKARREGGALTIGRGSS